MALIQILSAERFSTYQIWAKHDDALAERLYSYNVKLSADFYSSLHMLEIALRNMCDQALSAKYGPNWFDDQTVVIDPYQQTCVREARHTLSKEGKTGSHGQVISELNFGFWSSLFGKKSNHLWGTIRPIFKAPGIKRADISGKLRDLRKLRNRIAHYEPILAQPLASRHADVLNLTAWLSVDAAAWITTHCPVTYPATPILVPDAATGVLVFDQALIGHLS